MATGVDERKAMRQDTDQRYRAQQKGVLGLTARKEVQMCRHMPDVNK